MISRHQLTDHRHVTYWNCRRLLCKSSLPDGRPNVRSYCLVSARCAVMVGNLRLCNVPPLHYLLSQWKTFTFRQNSLRSRFRQHLPPPKTNSKGAYVCIIIVLPQRCPAAASCTVQLLLLYGWFFERSVKSGSLLLRKKGYANWRRMENSTTCYYRQWRNTNC